MADQILNHKCPACTGPLRYDGASGMLKCDFCGSSYSVKEIEELYADKEDNAAEAFQAASGDDSQTAPPAEDSSGGETSWDYSSTGSEWGADGEKMRAYVCPSCGAELICDETTAATSCPYCGNPTVVPGQFSGTLKPDLIIPFKLDKDAAVAALKRHYEGKKLLPDAFSKENHIQEIKGVYVPFWLFDGQVDVSMNIAATTVRKYRQGNDEVTETSHYDLHREGVVSFDRIPADGSSKMPDEHMDSIEPFDYSELKPFSVAYLPGFMADKYDVSAQDCAQRADERARNTARQAIMESVSGYMTATPVSERMILRRGKVHYALLPVWMLSTKWNGTNYLFAMNGQTGKLVGDLPVSRSKFWGWFAKIGIPLTVVLSALLYFMQRFM